MANVNKNHPSSLDAQEFKDSSEGEHVVDRTKYVDYYGHASPIHSSEFGGIEFGSKAHTVI